jgi:Nucleotidyltransferase domain
VLDELVARARADDNVLGLIPHGSRARGLHVREESDWDLVVVVRELRGEYTHERGDAIELAELTTDGLAGAPAWLRPALLWTTPLLDKTGDVADALRAATTVEPGTAAAPLDAYVNSLYRSLKNARVGLELASLLDAQESIPWFLEFLFAVHGRVRPYNKWLEWELEHHPLPVAGDAVSLVRLERIVRTGDVEEQRSLFRAAEELARSHGLGRVIDGWEPDVAWLRGSGGYRDR